MTSRSNGDSFSYDANGNMISQFQDGVTWTQTFDLENRLVSVSNGTTTTSYVYDGAGNRVIQNVTQGGSVTTTTYVMSMEIEKTTSSTKSTVYYAAGGAFRVYGGTQPGLFFRHTDQLGSTVEISNSSGAKVSGSDMAYGPFGEMRAPTDLSQLTKLTDMTYTGQHLDRASGGLMYYGARYYLPGIQHFISADSIVPNAVNSQAYNRYAYVLNNPIRFNDPTGHGVPDSCQGIPSDNTPELEACIAQNQGRKDPESYFESLLQGTGITFTGDGWTLQEKITVLEGVHAVMYRLKEIDAASAAAAQTACLICKMTDGAAWQAIFGSVTMKRDSKDTGDKGEGADTDRPTNTLIFYNAAFDPEKGGIYTVIHEIAHLFAYHAHDAPYLNIENTKGFDPETNDWIWGQGRRDPDGRGYQRGPNGEQLPFQQHPNVADDEDYADMFMNWVLKSFSDDSAGRARYNWINQNIESWLATAVGK